MKTKIWMPAVLACVVLSACAGTVPTSRSASDSQGEDVAEAGLAADVRIALLDKLGWDALDVDVEVDGGRARLSGEVDQRTTQELAEEVALSVSGVQRIDNRLRVKGDNRSATPVSQAVGTAEREVQDAVLEMRVGKNLLAEIGRYALDLEIEATDGVVSLRGTLPDRDRRQLALRVAEETSGVKQVVDLLQVRRP
ncbi:MAG TPA: BON domain-containing protein [Thermoanaerobaculia bacterium]|nr:BON domain-containing protein [Thermoanaerobaculia bacterium]